MNGVGKIHVWEHLPDEVLIKIFQLYVKDNSQKDLINILSNVCGRWKILHLDNRLWQVFDGSVNVKVLLNLCKKGVLVDTKKLYFSQCCSLKSEVINIIFQNMPNIRYINVNGVERLPSNFFDILIKYCGNVNEIDFSGTKPIEDLFEVDIKNLTSMFSLHGSNLLSINLSDRGFSSLKKLVKLIICSCPNLQEFVCFNYKKFTLSIKDFQEHCPKLKKLCVTPNITFSISAISCGFSDLEVLIYGAGDCFHSINDKIIWHILFKSTKLKVLDIRGNGCITVELLSSLPALDVEYLYLSNTKVLNSLMIEKISMIDKWSHSLKVLDISRLYHDYINDFILQLISCPNSKLESLYVNSTRVTCDTICKVIKSCSRLQLINLESCRCIRRGLKRIYKGRTEILSLLDELCIENSDSVLTIS